MPGPHFLSYSRFDGEVLARRLHDALEAGAPPFSIWLDKIDLKPGQDWDEQIVEAVRVGDTKNRLSLFSFIPTLSFLNRVLRLFDALAVADENGLLAEVRKAVAGKA